MTGIVQAKMIGRLGNQLFQYCCARAWARLHGARLEVPDWVGVRVFNLDDPPYSCELPEVNDGANGLEPSVKDGQVGIRLGGYFMTQRWASLLDRAEIKSHLRIRKEWLDLIGPPPAEPYIAAHVRQGDYIGHPQYCNVTEAAYMRACEAYGLPLDRLVWVHENEPRVVPGIPPEISFLPDFVTLMRAKVLLRANSSFSFWAGVLSDGDVYAPVVEDHVGWYDAPFVRGNWPRIAHTDRIGLKVENLHMLGEQQ